MMMELKITKLLHIMITHFVEVLHNIMYIHTAGANKKTIFISSQTRQVYQQSYHYFRMTFDDTLELCIQ